MLSQCTLQAFNGDQHSKWLDFGASGGRTAWLAYALPAARQPVHLGAYSLTSADDSPERDPGDWVLEGRPCTGKGTLADLGGVAEVASWKLEAACQACLCHAGRV